MQVRRGDPYPLGATWNGRGVNVAVFSDNANSVDLCLFDDASSALESGRLPLPAMTGRIWHGYFPDLRPGRLYGFRAQGPYRPGAGHRFHPNKVLFARYAKAVGRDIGYDDTIYGHPVDGDDLGFDSRDDA